MAGLDVKIELPSEATGAVMGRWLVRRGDSVQEGKLLARYTLRGGGANAGQEMSLRCPGDGTVSDIVAKEGAGVGHGQVVCRIGDCAHLDTYAGICCTCGSDVIAQAGRKKDGEEREGGEGTHYGMFGSVSHPAFRRSAQSALNEEMERLRSMIKNRKLALVLDLDHTLLHTTMPRSPYQVSILQRICGISDEVFQLNVGGHVYYTKLRPHLRSFLHDLSSLFELYVYTAGDRAYADKIAGLLDHTGRWFSGRVISRDDYPDVRAEHKKLDKIFPFDAHWATAIILDDNAETWNQVIEKPGERKRNSIENLIHVVKYKFWSNDLGETHNPVVAGGSQDDEAGAGGDGEGGDKSGDKDASSHDSYIEAMFAGDRSDGQLPQLQRLLTSIHTTFFMRGAKAKSVFPRLGAKPSKDAQGAVLQEGQDVRSLLRDEYCSILKGTGIVFSGFGDQAGPQHISIAEHLGATCTEHITHGTTHLVVVLRKDVSADSRLMLAVERGDIEIVSAEWVDACRKAWQRESEEDYRPYNWEKVHQEVVEAIGEAKKKGREEGSGASVEGEGGGGGGGGGGKRKRGEEGGDAPTVGGGGGEGCACGGMDDGMLQDMLAFVGDVDAVLNSGEGGNGEEERRGGDGEGGGNDDEGEEGENGELDLEAELEDALGCGN